MRYSSGVTVVVKKYSNRRLYDTEQSRYVTLDELADTVRRGNDVRVVDAKSGADLTQQTLAQIILESRGAARLLPAPLLAQLIRMEDEEVAEFFSGYMIWALDLYLRAKRGLNQLQPYAPWAQVPIQATNAMARMFGGFGYPQPPPVQPPVIAAQPEPEPPEPEPETEISGPPAAEGSTENGASTEDLAALRKELDELKSLLKSVASAKSDD